jgi:hypothetical protein
MNRIMYLVEGVYDELPSHFAAHGVHTFHVTLTHTHIHTIIAIDRLVAFVVCHVAAYSTSRGGGDGATDDARSLAVQNDLVAWLSDRKRNMTVAGVTNFPLFLVLCCC